MSPRYTSLTTPARPPPLARLLSRKHLPNFLAAQELVLLMLVGVCSTLLASFVDKSVDMLSDARTRHTFDLTHGAWSYLLWVLTSCGMCAISAACVHFISPSAVGSGIPQMK